MNSKIKAISIGAYLVVVRNEPEDVSPMREEAFYGLAGDFVRLIEPETEAHPVALLANFLVAAGVLFGRSASAVADGKSHYPNEYLLLVGGSGAAGRKGTASGRVLPVMEDAEPGFGELTLTGLSSAEGLIKAIAGGESNPDEQWLDDSVKRFLAYLPEFASLLGVMKREGNILSAVLRSAWDGDNLRVLTRKEPLFAKNVHLSAIAHITPEELLSNLSATDKANGFANRFLLTFVRRSKCLPEGGANPDMSDIVRRLREAVEAARFISNPIRRDEDATKLWAGVYPRLTDVRPGLRGALLGRADAHVLRLSMLYALLDSSSEIRVEHLRAALAFWEYCENSIKFIFSSAASDPDEQKILDYLASGPATVSELSAAFSNNRSKEWLEAKLTSMVRNGLLRETTKDGKSKEGLRAWMLAA